MQINIEKRVVLVILGVVLLLAGALVYAYGGTQPSVMGHSLGELGIRESGYSIFLFPTGSSYEDCKTTCDGKMQILLSNSSLTCFSYTGGESRSSCRSTQVKCGDAFLSNDYCATKNTVNVAEIGKILVD